MDGLRAREEVLSTTCRGDLSADMPPQKDELDLIEPLLPLAEDNEEAAPLYARTSSRPEPEIEELVVWIGGVR